MELPLPSVDQKSSSPQCGSLILFTWLPASNIKLGMDPDLDKSVIAKAQDWRKNKVGPHASLCLGLEDYHFWVFVFAQPIKFSLIFGTLLE